MQFLHNFCICSNVNAKVQVQLRLTNEVWKFHSLFTFKHLWFLSVLITLILSKDNTTEIPLTVTHEIYTILFNVLWLTPVDWITKHTTQESFRKNLHYYVLVNRIVWEGGKRVNENIWEWWKSKHKKKEV